VPASLTPAPALAPDTQDKTPNKKKISPFLKGALVVAVITAAIFSAPKLAETLNGSRVREAVANIPFKALKVPAEFFRKTLAGFNSIINKVITSPIKNFCIDKFDFVGRHGNNQNL